MDPLPLLSAALFRRRLVLSALVFVAMGVVMNAAGHALSIAWFRSWWQVIPCYLGYVLPLALIVRGSPVGAAWRTCVLAFIPLELIGYAIGTSVVADGNMIAKLMGPHNFTLVMVLIVSPVPLVGNAIVDGLCARLDGTGTPPPSAVP